MSPAVAIPTGNAISAESITSNEIVCLAGMA
jgi:hypothetical protein